MASHDKKRRRPQDEADDLAQVIAYLCGDLSQEEREEFELRMRQDEALRQKLGEVEKTIDSAREWVLSAPPGAERLDSLKAPQLVRSLSVQRPRAWFLRGYGWRAAAAALIFIAGFAAGRRQTASSGEELRPPFEQARHNISQTPAVTPTPAAPKPDAVKDSRAVELAQAAQKTAPAPTATYTRQQDGRVIVETTLQKAGTRATWVVDGQFQLAQASASPTRKDN